MSEAARPPEPPRPPRQENSAPRIDWVARICSWIVVLQLIALCCVGALKLVKSFITFGLRSKQSEARVNLKALYVAEKAYFAEKDAYSDDLGAIGFNPERLNRYSYFGAADGKVLLRGQGEPAPAGAASSAAGRTSATSPEPSSYQVVSSDLYKGYHAPLRWLDSGCPLTLARSPSDGERYVGLGAVGKESGAVFVAGAVALLKPESPPRYDCWSIASVERKNREGEVIPAGVPYLEATGVE